LILSTGNSPNDRNEWTELVSSKRQYSKELRDLSEKIIEVDSTSRDLGKDIRTERTKLKESVYKLNFIKEKITVLNSELSKISENLSKSKGFLTLMESRLPKEDEQTLLAELLESKAKIDNNPTQSQFRKNETLEHYKMISMSLEAIKAVKMVKEQVSKLRSDSKDLNDKIMKADQEVSNLQSERSKQNNTIGNLVSFKTLLQEKRQSIMNQYNQSINLLEKVNARLDTLAAEHKTLSGSRHSQSTSNKYKILMNDFREKAQEKIKAGEKLTLDELRVALEEV
jgi:chromosome segregation ATPase